MDRGGQSPGQSERAAKRRYSRARSWARRESGLVKVPILCYGGPRGEPRPTPGANMARRRERSNTTLEPHPPPRNWRGGPFMWSAGVQLVKHLNSLSDPPRHMSTLGLESAKAVVDALLDNGYNAACNKFNKMSRQALFCLPRLEAKPPVRYARSTLQEATWHRGCWHPEHSSVPPPLIALFLILVTPEAHPRIRRCHACLHYFWARNLQQTTYCSNTCRSRSTAGASRRKARRTR